MPLNDPPTGADLSTFPAPRPAMTASASIDDSTGAPIHNATSLTIGSRRTRVRRDGGVRSHPKRNGGRHCCQPPLRRAKDLPVFATWFASTRRLWLTRSRSWLTSSGVAFHPTAPSEEEPDFYWTALPEGSLVFRRPACPFRTQFPNRSPGTKIPAKAVRCSAALLGVTTLASRFAHRSSEELPSAASRERRSPLPAPLPG